MSVCMLRLALVAALLGSGASVAAVHGDARKGKAAYAQCLACHALERDVVGPRHCGLFGRRAGSVPRFDYSPAMKRSTLIWDEKTLDRFLADPAKAVPGTSMTFGGIADPKERADLIAWLEQVTAKPCP